MKTTLIPKEGETLCHEDNIEWIEVNGIKNGLYRVWGKNNTLSSEYTYKNGKRDGKHIQYHDDGKKIKMVRYYKNGQLDGLCREWWSNGKLYDEFYYKNGELDGTYVSWYEDGQMAKKTCFKNGNMDVYYISFDEDGSKFIDCKFTNEKIVTFDEWLYGKKIYECDFERNVYKEYNEDNMLIENHDISDKDIRYKLRERIWDCNDFICHVRM